MQKLKLLFTLPHAASVAPRDAPIALTHMTRERRAEADEPAGC